MRAHAAEKTTPMRSIYIAIYVNEYVYMYAYMYRYGVATISRLLKIVGLFFKRAL